MNNLSIPIKDNAIIIDTTLVNLKKVHLEIF